VSNRVVRPDKHKSNCPHPVRASGKQKLRARCLQLWRADAV